MQIKAEPGRRCGRCAYEVGVTSAIGLLTHLCLREGVIKAIVREARWVFALC